MSKWLPIGFCFFLLSGSTKKSKGGWIVIKASPPVVFVHYAWAACERQRAATYGEQAKWKSADGQSWRTNIDLFSVRVKKEVAQVAFSRLTGGGKRQPSARRHWEFQMSVAPLEKIPNRRWRQQTDYCVFPHPLSVWLEAKTKATQIPGVFFFFFISKDANFPKKWQVVSTVCSEFLSTPLLSVLWQRVRAKKKKWAVCQTDLSALQESSAQAAGQKWWKTLQSDPVAEFQNSAWMSEENRAGWREGVGGTGKE